MPADNPGDSRRRRLLLPLADHLRSIHIASGQPSLRTLKAMTSWLTLSTMSEVLNGKTAPKLDFVLELQRCCLEYAAERDLVVEPHLRDPGRVRRLWEEQQASLRQHSSSRATDVRTSLPARTTGFVGRERELRWLDTVLLDTQRDGRLACVDGMPGVGKTELGVTWAHTRADRFPGGVVAVNLRGPSPTGKLDHAVALRRLLAALDVDTSDLLDTGQLVDRYRNATSMGDTCIVLDNALDEAHVRPLLPASGACIVISRDRLTGLRVREGAELASLRTLDPASGAQLLANRVPISRSEAATISAMCGGLPLALRLAAELLASGTDPGELISSGASGELPDVLDAATFDSASRLGTVFSEVYARRPDDERRLLARLAWSMCHDLSMHAMASIAGCSLRTARRLVSRLHQANLVTLDDGRATIHDLLRSWIRSEDPGAATDDAWRRTAQFYLVAADAMDRTLLPARERAELPATDVEATIPDLSSYDAALAWGAAEIDNVVAVVVEAVRIADRLTAAQLPYVMMSYLNLRKPWPQWISMFEAAVSEVGEMDALSAAHLFNGLGIAYRETGRWDSAVHAFHVADAQYERAGERSGRAAVLNNLAICQDASGDTALAVQTMEQAVAISIGDESLFGQAIHEHNLAEYLLKLGKAREALTHAERALEAARAANDEGGVATTMTTIGQIQVALGAPDIAEGAFRAAMGTQRRLGDTHGLGFTYKRLARLLADRGRRQQALEYALSAVEAFDGLGDRKEADDCRELLRALGGR